MIGIILLGAPGSGKGTQAKRLQSLLKVPHISTGDMLRQEIGRGSDLGLRVKDVLASGKLVDDQLMGEVIERRFCEEDVKGGFILDGYPRTLAQTQFLESVLKSKKFQSPRAVQIDLPEGELKERILGRLSCTKCGSSFHVRLNPPKSEEICDTCGASLIQRKDDSEQTVAKRLEVYKSETAPLLKYFKDRGQLVRVDGQKSVEAITTAIQLGLAS